MPKIMQDLIKQYVEEVKKIYGKRPIRGCIEISGCCM